MKPSIKSLLEAEIGKCGRAYIRDLAAAEVAVRRGQFNTAKVLRAVAHAQRVQAVEAARLLAEDIDLALLLRRVLGELETSQVLLQSSDLAGSLGLERCVKVGEGLEGLVRRAIASMEAHGDVLESDVAQSLWGCYGCGHVAEGDRPDICPVCGALGAEFEWFGPFYASTPEHLGQLGPRDILATLETIPGQVEAAISGVPDEALRRKPSPGEWCVKEIIGHMLETHLLFARRVRTILEAQGVPSVDTPVPPWKLQEGKGYEAMPAAELLERLRDARTASIGLVRPLKPEQWARRGTIRGASVTLVDLGTWLANHDRGHLAQVRRLCEHQAPVPDHSGLPSAPAR